jgi:hypothetical protein
MGVHMFTMSSGDTIPNPHASSAQFRGHHSEFLTVPAFPPARAWSRVAPPTKPGPDVAPWQRAPARYRWSDVSGPEAVSLRFTSSGDTIPNSGVVQVHVPVGRDALPGLSRLDGASRRNPKSRAFEARRKQNRLRVELSMVSPELSRVEYGVPGTSVPGSSRLRRLRPGFAQIVPDEVLDDTKLRRVFDKIDRQVERWIQERKVSA